MDPTTIINHTGEKIFSDFSGEVLSFFLAVSPFSFSVIFENGNVVSGNTKKKINTAVPSVEGEVLIIFFKDGTKIFYETQTGRELSVNDKKVKRAHVYT